MRGIEACIIWCFGEQLRQVEFGQPVHNVFTVNYLPDPVKQESSLVGLQKLFNRSEEVKQIYYHLVKERNQLQLELFDYQYPWQAK